MESKEQLLSRAFPGCAVLEGTPLGGGISAQATSFELECSGGARRRVVVRKPGAAGGGAGASLSRREHAVLTLARDARVPVPKPLFLDDAGGRVVLEFVDGVLDFAPADLPRRMRETARVLAAIHGIDVQHVAPELLPERAETISRSLREPPPQLDGALGEAALRAVLGELWPWTSLNQRVLLHGDYWPGNVLWQGDVIHAVLDWEEAELGDPLADVALTRLDLWWAYGREAAEEFTRSYRALTRIDWTHLPGWELTVALRPMSQLPRWADAYQTPAISRPDIDAAHMARVHREFVEQALSELGLRAAST